MNHPLTQRIILFSISSLLLLSCSKEIDDSDTFILNSEKEILEFSFLTAENGELDVDIEANVNNNDRIISVVLPYETPVRALRPTVKVSETATIVQDITTGIDFSESSTLTIMAEDGSSSDYLIKVRVVSSTQREILLAFLEQNPENTLDWNTDSQNIANWEGVVVIDNNIVALELDKKGLTVLPPEICDLFYLKTLSLEKNMITEIPRQIEDLSNNLKELNLGGNEIKTIPKEFFSLQQLTDLRVYTNELTEIPSDINKLTELKYLSLSNNMLETLPLELFDLSNLNSLYLNNVALTEIPEQITNLSQLTSLGISTNSLGSIPGSILDMKTLTRLDAANIGLTTIPSDISKLSNLKRLQLSENSIDNIPEIIGNLFELEFLYLQTNIINEVPDELSNLLNLKLLNISENNIVLIPNTVCELVTIANTEIISDNKAKCML